MNCATCNTPRRYVGVSCPARRLCPCETGHSCDECGKAATTVEFQNRITGQEPALPKKSNGTAIYFCNKHAPFSERDVPTEAAPLPSPPPPPIKREGLYRNGANLAPFYRNNPEIPPPSGSQSRERVECADRNCRDVHELRERKGWNGTESVCPKCGERVYTHAWEEAVA